MTMSGPAYGASQGSRGKLPRPLPCDRSGRRRLDGGWTWSWTLKRRKRRRIDMDRFGDEYNPNGRDRDRWETPDQFAARKARDAMIREKLRGDCADEQRREREEHDDDSA